MCVCMCVCVCSFYVYSLLNVAFMQISLNSCVNLKFKRNPCCNFADRQNKPLSPVLNMCTFPKGDAVMRCGGVYITRHFRAFQSREQREPSSQSRILYDKVHRVLWLLSADVACVLRKWSRCDLWRAVLLPVWSRPEETSSVSCKSFFSIRPWYPFNVNEACSWILSEHFSAASNCSLPHTQAHKSLFSNNIWDFDVSH